MTNREEQIYKAADKATYQTPPQYSKLVHKSRKVMSAYGVGFIDGCLWADSHPQWIPVEEELPPKSINDDGEECDISVDVFVTDGENIGATCYSHEQKRWWWCFNVTHWMLPMLPGRED